MDPARRHLALPLLACVWLGAGCIRDAGVAGTVFACEADDACLAGSACVSGACAPAGRAPGDAGSGDDVADVAAPLDAAGAEDSAPGPDDADDDVVVDLDVDVDADADGPCDPIRQLGCGPDENCTFLGAFDEPQCEPSGPAGEGEPCSGQTPCAVGLCAQLSAGLPFVCFGFCATVADCDGETCLDVGQSFGLCQIPGLYAPCDLLTGTPCVAGQGCYLATGEEEPVCLPAGTATVAQACDNANDCNVGLACVLDACRQLCTVGGDDCGDEETCEAYLGAAGWCGADDL